MLDIRLYIAQRLSAIIMAPLVLIHLGLMVYAIQGGLDAAEILGRTRNNFFWGILYALFVFSVAIHASIGLRVVVYEIFGASKKSLDMFTWIVALLLLILGARAVYSVFVA